MSGHNSQLARASHSKCAAVILLLAAQAVCCHAIGEELAPLVQSTSESWGGTNGPISFRMTDQEIVAGDEIESLEDFTFFDEEIERAQYQQRLLPLTQRRAASRAVQRSVSHRHVPTR